MAKAVVVPLKRPARSSVTKPTELGPRHHRRANDPVPPPLPRQARMSRKKVIEESRRWLSIINAHRLNEYKRRKVVTDTIENFQSYYNKGYLEYRKSVTEGGQFAAVEWCGQRLATSRT